MRDSCEGGKRPDGGRSGEVFKAFLKLGADRLRRARVAHLGYFPDEFVQRRKWLDREGLCRARGPCASFLPGHPPRARFGFRTRPAAGGPARGPCGPFHRPLPSLRPADARLRSWRRHRSADDRNRSPSPGLKDRGCRHRGPCRPRHGGDAVSRTAPGRDWARRAARSVLAPTGSAGQIGAIVAGAVAGYLVPGQEPGADLGTGPVRRVPGNRIAALAICAILLAGLPLVAATASIQGFCAVRCLLSRGRPSPSVADTWCCLFARSGNRTHRLDLPLTLFLAGYGAAQALPGPLFTFRGLFSARSSIPDRTGSSGAMLALFPRNFPARLLLLLVGIIPFWDQGLRRRTRCASGNRRGECRLSSEFWPARFTTRSYQRRGRACIRSGVAAVCFLLLEVWKLPAMDRGHSSRQRAAFCSRHLNPGHPLTQLRPEPRELGNFLFFFSGKRGGPARRPITRLKRRRLRG